MTLLLTSFAPWRSHQVSNTSDDLLAALQVGDRLPPATRVIRQLPVNFHLAPGQVINAMFQYRPRVVVCCGMAENRVRLNLERYARFQGHTLETGLNLERLQQGTLWTETSTDAGNYVCNYLYYRLLHHIAVHRLPTHCVFIHVPKLTAYTRRWVEADLGLMLFKLADLQDGLIRPLAADIPDASPAILTSAPSSDTPLPRISLGC